MRILSYRNKRRAKTALWILLGLLIAAALFISCRFLYLQRFLVFTDEGVQLDFDLDLHSDRVMEVPPDRGDFPIEFVTEEESTETNGPAATTGKPLSGYYISTDMLLDTDAVSDALAELEAPPQALLFEMKSIYGNFYYDSDLPGAVSARADIRAIDSMITDLREAGNVYLIARIPSLTDNNFALDNQSCGLPLRSGALWMDERNCYWLDPLNPIVQEFLIAIAEELMEMGFDEIVFDSFQIPDSENIVYDAELTREEAAIEAARAIQASLASETVKISFGSTIPALSAYSDRVYLTTESGSSVAELVAGFQDYLHDLPSQIVFQTASRDTRFNGYGILRPLIEGTSQEDDE